MESQGFCPRCGKTYWHRTVCPLCLVRLRAPGAVYAGGFGPAGTPDAIPARFSDEPHELPPPLIVLGICHGIVAVAALRIMFGVLLGFHRSGALPSWVMLPAVLYLSAAASFCGFSCYGLLSRRAWADGETRRALGLLLALFPPGTVWGIAWLAYLKRLSRPAAVVVQAPPPQQPPAPPAGPPAETLGGTTP